MTPDDPLTRILYVDLSTKSFRVESDAELFKEYLGGTGVAVKLFERICPKDADPLGEDNPIIFAVGPLTGLYPLASKTVAVFKSPHTGNFGESHCGGRSAVAIRSAGYGAIVITGSSTMPVYIAIDGDTVHFRDARTLWGMGSSFTVGRIVREAEPGAGVRSIMRIGRAGEQMVSYACVTAETYRHFGRLGLGAVFGSKKLKAVVVSGKKSIPVPDMKEYTSQYNQIYHEAVNSELMRKYHDLGTAGNVAPLNEMRALPTRNLMQSSFDNVQELTGEKLAQDYLGRRLACAHCPIGCIHIAALREPYDHEPYFYKTTMVSYDYEPIFAVGSLLGMSDAPSFLRLMDRIEHLGLDVMSAGAVLAWATEAFTNGLISENETDHLRFSWGDADVYEQAADRIVSQPNDFYRCLSKGVTTAAENYGGSEYALAVSKNEIAGYHTGPGAYVGFAVGGRHSHLDNAGYSIDQKKDTQEDAGSMASTLIKEEQWRQILSSLVVCFFARGIFTRETVCKALKTAGYSIGEEDLVEIGRKIYFEKYAVKLKHGFSFDDVSLPKRITETESGLHPISQEYFNDVVGRVAETVHQGIRSLSSI